MKAAALEKASETKQAFCLETVQEQKEKQNRITALVTDTIFIWMYLAALSSWSAAAFGLPISMGACLLIQAVAAVAVQMLFGWNRGKHWWKLLGWCVILLVTAFAFYKIWSSGIHLLLNAAENEIGKRFPYMLPAYSVSVSEAMENTAVYFAVTWLALLFALPGWYFIKKGNRILLGVQILVLLVFQAVTGIAPSLLWESVSLLCWIGVWMRGHQEKIPQGRQKLAGIQTMALVLVLAIPLILAGNVLAKRFLPETTVLTEWKTAMLQKTENARYQGKSKVLPDGNFEGLDSFTPKDRTVLEVTMSQPASYYLRGFTGCNYTGTGWTEADTAGLWANRDLFYWLHQKAFYGQELLGDAAEALGSEADLGEKNTIQIKNLNGNAKYCYVPYELQSEQSTMLRATMDAQKIGDAGILTQGWKGSRSYSYEAFPNQITNYPKYAAALLEEDSLSEAGKDYKVLESYYNEFAYATYLSIPAEINASLSSILGQPEMEEGERHMDYAKAKQNILYALTASYKDTSELAEKWEGSDFISDFLELSKEGYSVHFASAATMMFRYYGIPARYVEGYLITPEDVKSMQADETYKVDETHAHAWVEYYQDGVGWLPFETTPSYLNTMEQSDDYQDISGISGQSPQDENQPNEDDTEEKENEDTYDFDWFLFAIIVMSVLIVLLLLTMISFLVWVILQRRKSKKAKGLFESEDRNLAIRAMFEYTMNLFSVAGLKIRNTSLYRYEKPIRKMFDEDIAKKYRCVVDIRQEAVYSGHESTEEQWQESKAFEEEIWERIYTNGSKLQRMQLKYIYFL